MRLKRVITRNWVFDFGTDKYSWLIGFALGSNLYRAHSSEYYIFPLPGLVLYIYSRKLYGVLY